MICFWLCMDAKKAAPQFWTLAGISFMIDDSFITDKKGRKYSSGGCDVKVLIGILRVCINT